MKTFKYVLYTLLLLGFLVGCSNLQQSLEEQEQVLPRELTTEEKLEDFDYLFKVISENYPYLEVNKRTHGIDWVANEKKYRDWVIDTENDLEFFDTLNVILSDLNNGHTSMLEDWFAQMARDVYQHAIDMFPDSWYELIFANVNHSLVTTRYRLEDVNVEGYGQEETSENDQRINAKIEDVFKEKIAYIQIPQMIQSYERALDEELINHYLNEVKDYQALVIDIRDNGGGCSLYWADFLLPKIINKTYHWDIYTFYRDGDIVTKYVNYLENARKISDLDRFSLPLLPPEIQDSFTYYEKTTRVIEPDESSIKFTGNVYLLVNKNVYSSSESLAVFSKDSGFATLIGERTGGDGIGTDPWIEMLPNSGFLFRFTKEMGTTADGSSNEEHKTTPHYEVDATPMWDDLLNDNSIKKVLKLEGLKVED